MSKLASWLNWLRITLIVLTLSAIWVHAPQRTAWVVKTSHCDYVYWTDTVYTSREWDAETASWITFEYFGGERGGCHRFFASEKLAERIEKANK